MFSFPSSPAQDQIIAGPDGQWLQWDGVRWILVGLPVSNPEFEGALTGSSPSGSVNMLPPIPVNDFANPSSEAQTPPVMGRNPPLAADPEEGIQAEYVEAYVNNTMWAAVGMTVMWGGGTFLVNGVSPGNIDLLTVIAPPQAIPGFPAPGTGDSPAPGAKAPILSGGISGSRFIKNPDKPIGEYGAGGTQYGGAGGGAALAPPVGFLRFGDLIIRWGGATGLSGSGGTHYLMWQPAHSGPLGWYAFRRLSGTRYDLISAADGNAGRFSWYVMNDGGPGAQMMWIAIGPA